MSVSITMGFAMGCFCWCRGCFCGSRHTPTGNCRCGSRHTPNVVVVVLHCFIVLPYTWEVDQDSEAPIVTAGV